MVRGDNDGCAPAGRHGRAHRHRPYQTPSYFSTQSYTNKITIYTQSIQTTSAVHVQHPNDTVGAVPMCPPERPHSGVSIPKKVCVSCAGNLTTDAPLRGDTGGHTGTAPTKLHHTSAYNPPPTTSTTQTKRVNNPHNTSGAEMHRALPPPFFKTSCVCKLASR